MKVICIGYSEGNPSEVREVHTYADIQNCLVNMGSEKDERVSCRSIWDNGKEFLSTSMFLPSSKGGKKLSGLTLSRKKGVVTEYFEGADEVIIMSDDYKINHLREMRFIYQNGSTEISEGTIQNSLFNISIEKAREIYENLKLERATD